MVYKTNDFADLEMHNRHTLSSFKKIKIKNPYFDLAACKNYYKTIAHITVICDCT